TLCQSRLLVTLWTPDPWAGEPPVSDEVMLPFIRRTRSATGLHCQARLDAAPYATGQKVSKAERRAVRLKRRPLLPRWNYTIYPRPVSVHGPRVTKGERPQSRGDVAWQ